MKIRAILSLALALSSAAAVAQTGYLEKVTYPVQIFSNATHDQPKTYDLSSHQYPYGPRTTPGSATVTFVSATAPSVLARVRGEGGESIVEGQMEYEFYFSGPASSFVPINFLGHFALSTGAGSTRSYFTLSTNSPYWDFGSGVASMAFQCIDVCGYFGPSSASKNSSIDVSYTAQNGLLGASYWSSALGTFSGVVMGATGANGQGRGTVKLLAYAYTANRLSTAFIDPYLSIDASYLAAHPEATLTLPAGVGNEITAVPEPQALLLMLAGLGALALRRRAA